MYELSAGARKNLRFEDIAVAAFKKYTDDFHLRGYPEFPDSGDLVHKPLYDFRKSGLVEAGNKIFTLTLRGLSAAETLKNRLKGREIMKEGRLSGFAEREISRIESLESLRFYLNGEEDKILDTDFFAFLGVTVRTPKNDFIGRLDTVKNAVNEVGGLKNLSVIRNKLPVFSEFMLKRFEDIINQKSK